MNKDIVSISSLPDEVLEFIFSLVSPYGDLKACGLCCRRWHMCSKNVVRKRQADFRRAVQDMKISWSSCTNATTANLKEPYPAASPSIATNDGSDRKKALVVGKRYSHSAVYDEITDSMYIFGGCTSSATTFNDLWRMDLTTRTWHRPTATGTYPSPKACSVLVKHGTKLILFGGWTHPSMYPLHRWRLFNELHSYDLETSRWTQLLPPAQGAGGHMEEDIVRPPTMAGHSATVHQGRLIVYGGLQKQRNSIGQFSSSSDVWSFDLERFTWVQEDIPDPRPKPRYGQSQLYLDETHLLILGGCGGPSNIFNDIWLLTMGQSLEADPIATPSSVHWKWVQCRVENSGHGANHMWCHPAVRIGNCAVILGKNRLPKQQSKTMDEHSKNHASAKQEMDKDVTGYHNAQSASTNQHQQARWNVIPQISRGVNRGYGAIRRPHSSSSVNQRLQQNIDRSSNREYSTTDSIHSGSFDGTRNDTNMSDNDSDLGCSLQDESMSISDEEQHVELAVVPVGEHNPAQGQIMADSPTTPIYRSCVTLNINDTQNIQAKPTHTTSDSSTIMSPTKGIEQMAVSSNEANPQFQQYDNVLESMPCRQNTLEYSIGNDSTAKSEDKSTIEELHQTASISLQPSSVNENQKSIASDECGTSFKLPSPISKFVLTGDEKDKNIGSSDRSPTKQVTAQQLPKKLPRMHETVKAQASDLGSSLLVDKDTLSQAIPHRGSSPPKVSAISFNRNAAEGLGAIPRLQAFAVPPNVSSTKIPQNFVNSAKSRQMETRQRQLDALKRMEERYRNIDKPSLSRSYSNPQPVQSSSLGGGGGGEDKVAAYSAEGAAASSPEDKIRQQANQVIVSENVEQGHAESSNHSTCACQRLTIHVLDISKAISNNVVTWRDVRMNSSLDAPEETILYSLVKGKGELVMFGGIQKDVSSITRGGSSAGAASDGDTVSNAVYFLNPPSNIV